MTASIVKQTKAQEREQGGAVVGFEAPDRAGLCEVVPVTISIAGASGLKPRALFRQEIQAAGAPIRVRAGKKSEDFRHD